MIKSKLPAELRKACSVDAKINSFKEIAIQLHGLTLVLTHGLLPPQFHRNFHKVPASPNAP